MSTYNTWRWHLEANVSCYSLCFQAESLQEAAIKNASMCGPYEVDVLVEDFGGSLHKFRVSGDKKIVGKP